MAVVPAAGPYVVSTFLSTAAILAQQRRLPLPLHRRFPLRTMRTCLLLRGCRMLRQCSTKFVELFQQRGALCARGSVAVSDVSVA